MFATPAAVLGMWFRGLIAIAVLIAAGWLVSEWYDRLPSSVVVQETTANGPPSERRIVRSPGERIGAWRPGLDRETAMLSGALLLFVWSMAGRLLSVRLLRKPDSAEQPALGKGAVQVIERPDGTQLHVHTHGPANAPTVILTHGWGMHSEEWAYLSREWGTKFRLVLWDLPGLGRSTRPDNHDFSVEKMAHDLRAVVEASGERPVILVGHSIGGMIILTFCKLFPELLGTRVSRLVLVHTSYTNPLRTMAFHTVVSALQKPLVEPLLYLQILLSPLVRLMNWLSYINGSVHNSTARTGFAGTESRNKLDFVASFSPLASPAVLARGALGMLKYDATETLRSIPIPVLVFTGDRDPVTLPEAGQRISKDVATARLHPLTPAKHYGMIEHDVAFARSAAAFCNGDAADAPAGRPNAANAPFKPVTG